MALPDVAGGYWLLQASDTGGQVWNNSTLVFTSVASNPDQTYAVSARIDWFEDAGTFGMLLGGEETDEGSYDPISHTLLFDQTGGWASETLDHYQATYDPGSDALIDGFWDTGNPGTISGMRRLSGILLEPPQAQATSQQSGQVAANMVDGDMFTYWSSANNATTGQIITLTLAAPSRLRGLRILSVLSGNAAAPAQLSVSSRDAGGAEVDVSSVAVPNDVMWKPVELVVDELVSELQIEVTALEPAGGNRIVISGLEVFGLP